MRTLRPFSLPIVAALIGVGVSSFGPAMAASNDRVVDCLRDGMIRKVRVVQNPNSNVACEVRYQKASEGGAENVLWHAQTDTGFCRKQAKALTARLADAGWTCLEPNDAQADLMSPAETELPLGITGSIVPEPLSVAKSVSGADARQVPAVSKVKQLSRTPIPVERGSVSGDRPALSTDDPAGLLRPSVH